MSEIRIEIDGNRIKTASGITVLKAAQSAGISIPTLCHHDKLEPFGGCRLCLVEAEVNGQTKLVVSCVYPVKDDLIIRTRSKKIDRIRKTLLELLLAHAPKSPRLQELAQEYGAEKERFEKEASFCIHCGLCVRYCAEVKNKHAVGFIDRGIHKEIRFIPEITLRECDGCKECFSLCPTSYLQAQYVLVRGLACPSDGFEDASVQ